MYEILIPCTYVFTQSVGVGQVNMMYPGVAERKEFYPNASFATQHITQIIRSMGAATPTKHPKKVLRRRGSCFYDDWQPSTWYRKRRFHSRLAWKTQTRMHYKYDTNSIVKSLAWEEGVDMLAYIEAPNRCRHVFYAQCYRFGWKIRVPDSSTAVHYKKHPFERSSSHRRRQLQRKD